MNLDMHWVDTFILAVIGVSALLSLFRGLVREVLSLLAWVVAGGAAYRFAGPASAHLAGFVEVPSLRMGIAFIAILLGVLLVFGVLNYLVGKLLESTGLGATDRLLGIVFGVARGVAIVTVIVMLAGLGPFPRDPWWHESRFLPRFEGLARLAIAQLPPEFARHFEYDRPRP
ncbi:MAG: CvpA family protein [Gammaproteobacteria bacterium]